MTGGVAVIRYLLAHNQAILTLVSAERILAGEAPLGIVLPAIEVRHVSGVPRNTIWMGVEKRMQTDRVQVSALVKGPFNAVEGGGYPDLVNLMALIVAACPNQRGTVNGVQLDSILPDLEGPDLSDPNVGFYTRSRDFFVKYLS